jgi:hypothetical protein
MDRGCCWSVGLAQRNPTKHGYDPAMDKPGYDHTLITMSDYFTQSGVMTESFLVRSPFWMLTGCSNSDLRLRFDVSLLHGRLMNGWLPLSIQSHAMGASLRTGGTSAHLEQLLMKTFPGEAGGGEVLLQAGAKGGGSAEP